MESLAKSQAENTKKDAELAKIQAKNMRSSRHNHQQVSVAQDHDKMATLQDENAGLREQKHENTAQLLVLLHDAQPPKPHEPASAGLAPRAASPQRKPMAPITPDAPPGMAEPSVPGKASPSLGLVRPRPEALDAEARPAEWPAQATNGLAYEAPHVARKVNEAAGCGGGWCCPNACWNA